MRYRSFDRYVRRAMKEISIDGSFNEGSVHLLNIFVEENDEAIKKVQKTIKNDLGVEYPPMKVVDMYLWQRGFELVCKEKQKKKVVKDNLSKYIILIEKRHMLMKTLIWLIWLFAETI